MKRWWVPGLPFALSLGLSLSTVGRTVTWQDSGFFLAGVKELGVLHPHGFVLYLLLAKAWTLVLGFLDFTLAVHLFSSFCAAVAAAAVALAARELLETRAARYPMPADRAAGAAAAAGCLAAAGYTLWSSALLAKSYALFYAILALLLWRMVRADASPRRSELTWVSALIGLAWAAHPSAAGLGVCFLLFAGAHRGSVGGWGLAGRAGLAAACALLPAFLLPALARRDPAIWFADLTSVSAWIRYLLGGAHTHRPGVFGVDLWRVRNALRFFWEEFLGVGLALLVVGLVRIARADRRLLWALGAWCVPSAALALAFRIEGQLDFWLVASWLPLYLAVAVGLAGLPARAPRGALLAAGAAGLAWAVAANGSPVSRRGYTLAERFGRYYLASLDPGAIVLLESDDALSTVRYLQEVRAERRDVLVVEASRLDAPGYLEHLRRLDPRVRTGLAPGAGAFARANVAPARPVYFEAPPPDLPGLVPSGPLLRLPAPGQTIEPRDPDPGLRGEELEIPRRRERGIRIELLPGDLRVFPEADEHRWVSALSRARSQHARYWFLRGGPEPLRKAAELLESLRAVDPEALTPEDVHLWGASRFLLREYDRAEPVLRSALRLGLTPRQRVRTCLYLRTICQAQGRLPEAAGYQEQAMAVVRSDPELRREWSQFSESR